MTSAAFFGLLTALAMGMTIQLGWTQLRERPVARPWLWLAALAVGLVPIAVATGQLLGLPVQVTMLAAFVPGFVMWTVAWLIARRLPAGLRLGDPDAPVFERVNAAGLALDVGDLDAATDALQAARDRARPRLAAYVALWLRLVDEERLRREGVRVSSGPTRDAITMEMTRLRSERARPTAGLTVLVLVTGVAVAAGLPLAVGAPRVSSSACQDAQPLLNAAELSPRATVVHDQALSHLTLVDPGEPAGNVIDTGLDLAGAAESRHDPNARMKLEAAGFLAGYHRQWVLLDGHALAAEVFRFASPSGAALFHRQATEYACRFANLAFAGDNGETGLQVRYSTGDRIVEQLAWVDGSLRIVVTRGFGASPPDHRLIIDLARRASERLAQPQPAGSPIVR